MLAKIALVGADQVPHPKGACWAGPVTFFSSSVFSFSAVSFFSFL
jgi:hypothetical protein